MSYDVMTMAEAVGEAPARPLTFIPGEDYDPYDEDDVAAVGEAMDRDYVGRLEAENARLRALVAELTPPF